MSGPAPTRPAVERPRARLGAAAVSAAQALVLVGFAAFYVYETLIGATDDPVRAVMSTLLILLGAAGLAVLTRGWLRGGSWPRTPTVVWNLLLLPVAWGLVQGQRALIGVLVGVAALVSLGCALAVPADDPEGEPGR